MPGDPNPADPASPRLLVRSDSAPSKCWAPAVNTADSDGAAVSDGELCDGAWVAEATGMISLAKMAGRVTANPAQGTSASGRAAVGR